MTAAVSCSSNAYRLGGVGFGSGTTGKLGHAWVVHGIGAWYQCMVLAGQEGACYLEPFCALSKVPMLLKKEDS